MNFPEHGKKSQGNLDTFGKPIELIVNIDNTQVCMVRSL